MEVLYPSIARKWQTAPSSKATLKEFVEGFFNCLGSAVVVASSFIKPLQKNPVQYINFPLDNNVCTISDITGSSNNPYLFLNALVISDFKVHNFVDR